MKLLLLLSAFFMLTLELTWALLESLFAPDKARESLERANCATRSKSGHK